MISLTSVFDLARLHGCFPLAHAGLVSGPRQKPKPARQLVVLSVFISLVAVLVCVGASEGETGNHVA